MSALARSTLDGSLTGLRMNARRYLSLGETAERYELVNGVVLMAPSASYAHNRMAAEVMYQLLRFAEETDEIVAVHETDVRFSDLDVYRPDVVAFKAARVSGRTDQLRVVNFRPKDSVPVRRELHHGIVLGIPA